MQNLKSLILFFGVVAVAVLVGCVIGWFGGGGFAGHPVPVPVAAAAAPSSESPPPPAAAKPKPAVPVAASDAPIPDAQSPAAVTNGEDAVQAILESEAEDAEKVKQLFALFPKLPPDAQDTVAGTLATLVPDENYAPLGRLLTDARLPVPVLDTLMSDAMARPNALMLPLMLELARNPAHAKAAEAKDTLATYLDKDCGTDWTQWQKEITAWLKDNPD
jgi:hypothetical protein